MRAALELDRRLVSLALEDGPAIGSSRDVADLLMAEMAAFDQEHLRALLLKRCCR